MGIYYYHLIHIRKQPQKFYKRTITVKIRKLQLRFQQNNSAPAPQHCLQPLQNSALVERQKEFTFD